jgi:hypothetical protein
MWPRLVLRRLGTAAAGVRPPPTTTPLLAGARVVTGEQLELTWHGPPVQPPTQHHALWLQDHDPAHVDPDSGQKLRAAAEVDLARRLVGATVEDGGQAVRLTWSSGGTPTVYRAAWLHEYATAAGRARAPWIDGAASRPLLWTAADLRRAAASPDTLGPEVDGAEVLASDAALWQLLQHLHDYGICFVRNVPTGETDASAHVAARIGPLHDTLYGRLWNVRSIPHAHNIAYTSGDLGLHQDLEYVEQRQTARLFACAFMHLPMHLCSCLAVCERLSRVRTHLQVL